MFNVNLNKYEFDAFDIRLNNPFLLLIPVVISGILLAKYLLDFYVVLFIICTILFILAARKIVNRNYTHKISQINTILLLVALSFSFSIRYHQVTNIHSQNHITQYDIKEINTINGIVIESHYYENNYNRYILNLLDPDQLLLRLPQQHPPSNRLLKKKFFGYLSHQFCASSLS